VGRRRRMLKVEVAGLFGLRVKREVDRAHVTDRNKERELEMGSTLSDGALAIFRNSFSRSSLLTLSEMFPTNKLIFVRIPLVS
jgi:hypothetical protein